MGPVWGAHPKGKSSVPQGCSAKMQTSLIGLEACSGAHFLGAGIAEQGHHVRLIAAQFVKPFVKSNKNDFVDPEAIAKAVERKPTSSRTLRRT